MDIQAEKSRLISLLQSTNNENIIADLLKVFENLYNKSYTQKELDKMIEEGEKDIKTGNVLNSNELLKVAQTWRKK
jgi:Trp operon repressor